MKNRKKYGRWLVALVALTFANSALAGDLLGTWTLAIDTPRGVQNPTLVVSQQGDSLGGIYNSRRGPLQIETIEFDGTKFSFPLVITVPIGEITVEYRGSIDGDAMRGVVQNPRGEVGFTGERTSTN